jgi:hypothetical protein
MLPGLVGEDSGTFFIVYDDPTPGNEQDAVTLASTRLSAGLTTIAQEQEELGIEVSNDPEARVLRVNGTPLDKLGETAGVGFDLFGSLGAPKPSTTISKPKQEESTPAPTTEGNAPVVEKQEAMTAAMATVLADLVKQFAMGELPANAAIEIASAAVPTLSRERLAKMFGLSVSEAPAEAPPAAANPQQPDPVRAMRTMVWDVLEARDPYAASCAACGTRSTEPIYESDEELARILRTLTASVQGFLSGRLDEWVRAVETGQTPPPIGDDLAREIASIYAQAFTAGYSDAPGVDADMPFSLVDEDAVAAVGDDLIRLSEDLDDATRDMVQSVTRQAIEQGFSTKDTQQALQDVVASPARAERIARTEIQYAANKGAYQRYTDVGADKVDWLTAPGATLVHQEIAKRGPLPMGEPFARAGETITAGGESETYRRDVFFPPARPNCRCSVAPVFGGSDQ